jgi:outer membrane protein OmpA-like peptidoglycan-associated protein
MTSNDSGFANFKLKTSAHYRLEVNTKNDASGTGYLAYNYMLSEKEVTDKKTFEAELEKVKHTDSGLVPAMHFEYNNPTLSAENKAVLDNVLKMLKSFPSLQIEIGVYADCHENDMLVTKRANAIKDYLATNDYIAVKEYGNTGPLNQCDCSNPHIICSEEKYLENRRAEFKVIAF